MTMIEVNQSPPSEFTIGDEVSRESQPSHRVTLSRTYFVCNREVWEDLFVLFLRDTGRPVDGMPMSWRTAIDQQVNTIQNPTKGRRPVWEVAWFDAIEFCNWLSGKEGRQPCYQQTANQWICDFDANGYRLPTEAEWEYACRAMTETTWYFGDDETLLPRYAHTREKTQRERKAGRLLQPNGFGLFDMYGNVCEWCWDWNGPLSEQSQTDPQGPPEGRTRVFRGGGTWNNGSDECRSAARNSLLPTVQFTNLGFRVVCSAEGDQN